MLSLNVSGMKKTAWNRKNQSENMRYKIDYDMCGNLNLSATITPEALHAIKNIADLFSSAINSAIKINQENERQRRKEQKEGEERRKQAMRDNRPALSIYRRTKSRNLASKAADWIDRTQVFYVVQDANARQRKESLHARNQHIYRLHTKKGHSIRQIARRYGLHPSTIHAIIKREAKKQHPALF